MDFDFESKIGLEKAMTISHSSANPAASDSSWEAYRSWMNSEISKMKDLGYTLAESKFRSRFVPLMELCKLGNSQLCLRAPEINEASLEAMEEEEEAPETKIVQHIESAAPKFYAPEHQDSVMEKAPNQIVFSKASASQPIPDSLLRTIEQIKADNAKVNERMDKKDLIFQLILSRLPPTPPPPPHNP